MVGVDRFELPTFWSQTRRATNCAIPRGGAIYINTVSGKISRRKAPSDADITSYRYTLIETGETVGTGEGFAHSSCYGDMVRWKKHLCLYLAQAQQSSESYNKHHNNGTPAGVRTRVVGFRVRSPRPLDERGTLLKEHSLLLASGIYYITVF